MNEGIFFVAIFDSVSHAMMAEKILKHENIPHKIIPVPKDISSDCGICIRFDSLHTDRLKTALQGRVDIREMKQLPS